MIPAQTVLLAPGEARCDGPNCRLPQRIIPADWQRYDVQMAAQMTFCRPCLVALNADQPHLFDGRNLFANGFRPAKYPEMSSHA